MPRQRARSTNATRLQFRFQEREERRSSMNCFLFWLAPVVNSMQWHENDHGEIDPTAPLDFRSWQRNKSDD
jgi:hypothetical protein